VQEAIATIERDSLARVVTPPADPETDPRLDAMARRLLERKPDRAANLAQARGLMTDPIRFAVGLVALGEADAAVAGATCPTSDVLRAALWLIGPAPGITLVSSSFYMVLAGPEGERVLTFTDAGVVPDPAPDQLVEIALAASADRRRIVGDDPVVAFLSFSTHGSASHPRVERVRRAAVMFRERSPDIPSDGELQVDAALVPEVAARKAPGSPVGGMANVLVFPDLDSGNIGYKLVERLAGAGAIGPIVQGLDRPVADLSRGATAGDVVDVATVALLQSEPSPTPA